MRCPKCHGTGKKALSKNYQSVVDAIQSMGKPTMLEVHQRSGNGAGRTGTNKRVARLVERGVVKVLNDRYPPRLMLVRQA